MAISDVDTAIAAIVSALEAKDYATAQDQLLIARAYLMGIPDAEHGSAKLTYQREQLDSLEKAIGRKLGSSLGPQNRKLKWAGPTE